MQEPALTTRDARETDSSLLTALGGEGTAAGELYLDDGESLRPNATLNMDFQATRTNLTASVRGAWKENNSLANVTVLGVGEEPDAEKVMFNGAKIEQEDVAYSYFEGSGCWWIAGCD